MEYLGLYTASVLAFATAAISITISKSKVFSWPRKWLYRRSQIVGELVNCHYCTSHWISLVLVTIYRPVIIVMWYPADLFVSLFFIVAVSAIVGGVMCLLTPFAHATPQSRGVPEKLPQKVIVQYGQR